LADATEWQIEIDNEDWTISVSGRMFYGLGPQKRGWIESEVKRLYPGSMDGPSASDHASTVFRGAGTEVDVFIDYGFADKRVCVCNAS